MPPTRLPTYFLSHGGGPWPWLKGHYGAMYDKLEKSLHDVREDLSSDPRAVLMISGHWEEASFTLSSADKPPMFFDYYGFPDHTYRIRYDAPGAPDIAEEVHALLDAGGISSRLDPARGFDHGTFTVMAPMFPEASIPIVQLSLKAGYDPLEHIRVGQLIAPLRDRGVLIIGSGFSYHDTMGIRSGSGGLASAVFDQWLNATLVDASPAERTGRLVRWTEAPAARAAHPSEDHLIPLMVAAGAAGDDAGHRFYHQADFMGSIAVSSFRFGDAPSGLPQREH